MAEDDGSSRVRPDMAGLEADTLAVWRGSSDITAEEQQIVSCGQEKQKKRSSRH